MDSLFSTNFIYDNMLWCWYKTMLYSSVSSNRFLICTCMEKPDIEVLFFTILRKDDLISFIILIIVVIAITSDSTKIYISIWFIPEIEREHDKLLPYSPSIWKGRNETAIDHIPFFFFILLLCSDNLIDDSSAFTYCIRSEFRNNIWSIYIIRITDMLDRPNYLIYHILIIILHI